MKYTTIYAGPKIVSQSEGRHSAGSAFTTAEESCFLKRNLDAV